MKSFIGVLSTIIILTGATLLILALWDIQPISLKIILRSGATIAVACVTVIMLWLIKTIFFQRGIFRNKDKENTPRSRN
ncbi:hypothetical protein [Dysgonomonas sp. ZJ279]|uniref:hypothetical protein n=1 Tax=Dysgonomonas sp. ZJ279 TaxID=2709796 RepID=UPI0013EE1AE4|nr:hypothetical protein [Dysgonomonas sp. ZJ279]